MKTNTEKSVRNRTTRLLLFAVVIFVMNTISAQETGKTITSPFGVARPSSASEASSDEDTFVDPETGEVGHIIRNPFGVASPVDVDTGIDIPDNTEEETGNVITNPFGTPNPDDVDTGVDVIDEDEEYFISLPVDEKEVDAEDSKDVDEVDDETSDDAKEFEEESAEDTTEEKYIPVKDNPIRGIEDDSFQFSLIGTMQMDDGTFSTFSVESETNVINNAPTLYVRAGKSFKLTLASDQPLPQDFQPTVSFSDLSHPELQNPFEPQQSGSNSPYCFVYHVPSTMDGGTYRASISGTLNGETVARVLKIEIVRVNKIVGPNSKSSMRSEAPSGTDKWQESEVIYAQPYSVFELTMEVEPSLSYDKIKDLISWSKSGAGGTLTPKENNKRKAEFKATTINNYTITASIGSSQKIIAVKVVAPKINTVKFSGAKIYIKRDNGTPYSGYAWKDDNLDGESDLNNANAVSTVKYQPVAYKSTSKITAQGTFKPNCLKIDKEGTSNPVSSDFIQGWDVEAAVKRYRFSHNNSDWSAWTETNPVIGKNKIKETAQVGYNLTFPIYWQYGFGETGTADGQLHAFDAGTSKHEMYLTYNAPITTDDLYETVFHISCTNANEEHSEDSVVSGIWDGFSGRNVKRKDGTELTYYASYQTDTTTVTGLLSNTDGQCGAWASFFQTALAIHGIQSEYKKFRSNPTFADGFIVKTWSFSGTGDVGSNFPYTNKLHPSLPLVGTTQYNWGTPAEVTYTEGNPGQNNSMPASFFNNNQLIKYGNKYYDPSYGVIYESVQKIDETLSGFYNKPLFEDEIYFRKNPSGVQIEFYE